MVRIVLGMVRMPGGDVVRMILVWQEGIDRVDLDRCLLHETNWNGV